MEKPGFFHIPLSSQGKISMIFPIFPHVSGYAQLAVASRPPNSQRAAATGACPACLSRPGDVPGSSRTSYR